MSIRGSTLIDGLPRPLFLSGERPRDRRVSGGFAAVRSYGLTPAARSLKTFTRATYPQTNTFFVVRPYYTRF